VTPEQSRAAHRASAELLARGALGVLQGTADTAFMAALLRGAAPAGQPLAVGRPGADTAVSGLVAAVGGVRLLGADVLAPYVLTRQALPVEDAAAVRLAFSALPPAQQPSLAPPRGPEAPWVRAWVDWGLAGVLARLDPDTPCVPVAMAQGPPPWDARAPRRSSATADAGNRGEGWVGWSLRMGQLASLALPGLHGPVHDGAVSGALALARGATRSLLRRDFATAARITRWLAWLTAHGVAVPLDVSLLIEDIALRGGGDMCLLDAEISRRLLAGDGS
jgi:hypothetical protein